MMIDVPLEEARLQLRASFQYQGGQGRLEQNDGECEG